MSTKNSIFVTSIHVDLVYRDFEWPNSKRNKVNSVPAVVRNIPINAGNKINDVEDIIETNINSSGKNPLVPGNPTLASEATTKKNENNGIKPSKPPNAIEDRVWYLSDKTPIK